MEELKERLKVTGRGTENTRGYLTVNYAGDEYRVQNFRFQDEINFYPEYLQCVIKDLGNGSYKINQDLEYVVPEIYQVGKTYPFSIVGKTDNYYVIVDKNGLRFRLTDYANKQLKKDQKVLCEVKKISGGFHVFTKLIEAKEDKVIDTRFINIQELSNQMNLATEEAELLEETILSHPAFDESKKLYEQTSSRWLLSAILKFDACLLNHSESRLFLQVFKKMALHLIERSHIVRELDDKERSEWMKKLTIVTQHAEDYQLAYDLLDKEQADDYIKEQLISLRESENLYQLDRKFRTILCLFNSSDQLMADRMDEIFDIILGGNLNHWMSEPFRFAFVEMLQIFISKYCEKTSVVGLNKLIKAIAIQLQLSKEEDGLNRRLNRSMLYRYLSYIKKVYSVEMLSKAFESLLTPYKEVLEYEWSDIADVNVLYFVVAAKMNVRPLNNVCQVFRENQIELLVEGNNITLQPINADYNKVNVVPAKEMTWNNLAVYLNQKTGIKLKGSKAISDYKVYWDAIEQNIMSTKQSTTRKMKEAPSVGDLVWIYCTEANADGSSFLCHIDSDECEGAGWLDLKQIVSYLSPSQNLANYFHTPDGKHLILPAKIISGQDSKGMYHFSMLEDIEELFLGTFKEEKEFLCKVTSISPEQYNAVSYNGASIRIIKDGCLVELAKDDVVLVRIDSLYIYRGQFEGKYVDKINIPLNIASSFQKLLSLMAYSDDGYSETEEVDEEEMEVATVKEIIYILDRMAVLKPTRTETYSYLAVASILSRMLGDVARVDYYRKRKSILLLFDQYEKKGSIDSSLLSKISTSADNDLIDGDVTIKDHVMTFKILDAINDRDNLNELYKICNETDSPMLKDACSLAMSLLLVSDFDLPEVKKQVFDKLNNVIGVTVKTKNRKDYGRETQTVEFKSSIIYPAGSEYHMKPYPHMQEIEIMKVVCSFLNSDEGGTLYIGVNNYGIAVGLERDFKYIGSNDLESYGRKIHHMIRDNFGTLAASCCTNSDWEKADGYDVFKMEINPCEELVPYCGKYYIRLNTEKRIIEKDELEKMSKHHSEAYKKWKKSYDEKQKEILASEPIPEVVLTTEEKEDRMKEQIVYGIATSSWRKNVVAEYEDDYMIDTVAFIHFLPNSFYKLTDEATYEEVNLSLAISESEAADGYLVTVNESGKVLLTNMQEVISKDRNKPYKRCRSEKPKFVCPAHKGDGVLTVWRGQKNDAHFRIDSIEFLLENHHEAAITSEGKLANEYLPTDGLLWADIVKEEDIPKFSKFYKNAGNQIGRKVSLMSFIEVNLFKELFNINVSDFTR